MTMDTYSPRASNRFDHVVEAKRLEGMFCSRKICGIQKSKSYISESKITLGITFYVIYIYIYTHIFKTFAIKMLCIYHG